MSLLGTRFHLLGDGGQDCDELIAFVQERSKSIDFDLLRRQAIPTNSRIPLAPSNNHLVLRQIRHPIACDEPPESWPLWMCLSEVVAFQSLPIRSASAVR